MNDVKGYGNLCKSHSARSEKEFCRVCPSKLNKKELEDVYFSLLENNLDLKQTINSQREKIKVLSTKIQRLTAVQKTYLGKEPKECCGSKAVILEQKECILELQRSNQCLSERVRQLNMRLCSAKQFLKRSPFQSGSRCNRCSNKTASMSALITKRSESNLRPAVASSQYLDKDIMSVRTADQQIVSQDKGVQYDFCEENKCRTHIEELKQKNENLEELLSQIREDLASRTRQYETQLSELRAENLRVRALRTQSDDSLTQLNNECTELTKRLGIAEIRCDELSVELSIEKRKVLELEMQVKAADMSSRIANAIETHLTSIKMVADSTNLYSSFIEPVSHETLVVVQDSPKIAVPSPRNKPKPAMRTKVSHLHVEDAFKNSDDSGYTEVNKSSNAEERASTYLNQVLLEKIADLQNQINNLKISKGYSTLVNMDDTTDDIQVKSNKTIDSNRILTDEKNTINSTFDESIISESSESVITEKNLKAFNVTKEIVESEKKKYFESKAGKLASDSIKEAASKNKVPTEPQSSKVSRNQINFNVRKRSQDKSRDVNNITDTRKLSLESSRGLAERNLIKTGSLDENRMVNIDNKGTSKENFAGNVKEPMSEKTITDSIRNKEIKQGNTFDKPTSDKETTNLNASSPINNILSDNSHAKETDNKDSDSSKGTYSIHKDGTYNKNTDNNNEIFNKNTANKDLVQNKEPTKPNDKTKLKKYESIDMPIDSKKKTKDTFSKDNVLEKHRSSTPSQARTYVLPGKGKTKPRDLSPESTECEISSLSDLPSERDEKASYMYRSPGEEKLTTTVSESRTDTTTTDYGSLSEGELPYVGEETNLSAGETQVPNRTGKSQSLPMSTSKQMQEALAMVKEELSRCTNLLRVHTRRSLDGTHRITDHV